MIVGAGLAIFPFIVLAILFLLPIVAVFGTIFFTRQGKLVKVASTFESFIRTVTVLLLLWIAYFGAPAISQMLAEFGIRLPGLTVFVLRLTELIRSFAHTPWQVGRLLFYCMSIVAIHTAFFQKLGVADVKDARKYSLIVSAITFSILGVMLIAFILPCIKLLNDLS